MRPNTLTLAQTHHTFLVGKFKDVANTIKEKIRAGESLIVLPCSLNDLASQHKTPSLKKIYSQVDFCTTDGTPLVWWFRWKTSKKIERVYGPDLMVHLLKSTQSKNYRHYFFGSSEQTMRQLKKEILSFAPRTQIVDMVAPPYRPLTQSEEANYLRQLKKQQPSIVWIGLSSPKQIERAVRWKKNLPHTTFLCVGAAFDFVAKAKQQAPRFIGAVGLEWLFRLITEPKRLYQRYLLDIPRYLVHEGLGKLRGD